MQEVEILVNGRPVRQIAHNGKVFVIAKEGSEYEIRLKNQSTSRVSAVCSVDGVNVVDGETATPQGTGYIIHGYNSYSIKGYRTSDDEVHPFVFSKKEKSYAANTENGSIEDVGVIGVTFWAEKKKPEPTVIEKHYHNNYPWYDPWYDWPRYRRPYRPYWGTDIYMSYSDNLNGATFTNGSLGDSVQCLSNSSSATNCSSQTATQNTGMLRSVNQMSAAPAEFDLGTKFSEKAVSDHVNTVEFEYGRKLKTIEIYYASRESLKAMGVPVERESAVTFPQAFKPSGYCKPPKNT